MRAMSAPRRAWRTVAGAGAAQPAPALTITTDSARRESTMRDSALTQTRRARGHRPATTQRIANVIGADDGRVDPGGARHASGTAHRWGRLPGAQRGHPGGGAAGRGSL